MRQTLIIMVKEPRPGQVKTRLGHDIGMIAAAWWYRRQVQTLIRRLSDKRWHIVLAVTPDNEGLKSRIWPRNLERMAQGSGDLGDRMLRMMLAASKGPVCLIGSDIPGVERTHIARAFGELGRNEAVFGPAPDGGFWLIGLKRSVRVPRKMFQDVRWSTEHALSDSLANMTDMRVALVDALQDVDTFKDLPGNVAIAKDV
ncbi:MAG: TIGR04282 family arsenosugar biosynthesis glycosyltransferase [Rhodobacteraceae bacterium]|nr:TIGR04282 family arsenosugar biosynthesis glycosyltransferase [Paracoccaceae bacterium]